MNELLRMVKWKEAIEAYFQVQLSAGSEENHDKVDSLRPGFERWQIRGLCIFEWRNEMNHEVENKRKKL